MSRRSQRARRQTATTFAAETWSGPATRGAFRRCATSTHKNEQQRSFHSRRKNREELLQRWLEETNQMKAQRRARFRSKEELEQVHYLEINAPPAYHLSLDGIPDETVVENWQPEELTVAGLREELKRRGLGLAGRRQQLVERLAQVLDQERSERKRQARTQRDEYHGNLDFTAFFHSMEGRYGPDHHEGQKTVTRPQLKSCIKKEARSLQNEQKEDEEEQEEQQEEDKEWEDKRIEVKTNEDEEVDAELRTKNEEDAKGGDEEKVEIKEKEMEEQKEEHRNEETKERSEESSDKTKAEELADVKSEASCVTSAVAMPKRKLVARCPPMTARIGTSYRQKPIDLYLSPPDPLLPSPDSTFQTTTPPPLSSPSSSASPEANRNQKEDFRSFPCHGNEASPLGSGNDTALAAALAPASAINTATFASASPVTISITAAASTPVETVTISSASSTQQLSSDNHSSNIINKKRKRYTKRPCSHNQKRKRKQDGSPHSAIRDATTFLRKGGSRSVEEVENPPPSPSCSSASGCMEEIAPSAGLAVHLHSDNAGQNTCCSQEAVAPPS
ncbi:Histone acetyltransferase [Balamuthia mandrillaris]